MEKYIKLLSEFYKINQGNLNIKSLNLEEINKDNRFDKETLTLLSINAWNMIKL